MNFNPDEANEDWWDVHEDEHLGYITFHNTDPIDEDEDLPF